MRRVVSLAARAAQSSQGSDLSSPLSPQDERIWMRAMIDQVPDYVYIKDIECRFVIANAAVAADLGRGKPEQLLGKTDYDLHPPEQARGYCQTEREVMTSGVARLDMDEFVVLPSGEEKWLSTSKLPLRNAHGVVVGLVALARDVTARRRAEDRANFLAFYDPLTGLPNRLRFEERLDQMLADTARTGAIALHYLDLDGFKVINNALGHGTGDALLRLVADRIASAVGDNAIARLGGDEFTIIQSSALCSNDAITFADKILDALVKPFDLGIDSAFVGASIGICLSADHDSAKDMLKRADIALYEAKTSGRGRVRLFAGEMAEAVLERRGIEQDLRRAIAAGDQWQLQFQPVFDAVGRKIVGAEALVRWKHPQKGLLPPGNFIAIAEDRGLIDPIGAWVMERACRAAVEYHLPWVAVNVSPIQFQKATLVDEIRLALKGTGLAPERLQIEITEGLLLTDSALTQATLSQLRDMGVKIALDDFGTGYSSMNYLRRYPVDKLKIDRSFVEELGTSAEADAILRSIVSLARALKMIVTAEGVETELQQQHLAAVGCNELQGFLLSRPIAIERMAELMDGSQQRGPNR